MKNSLRTVGAISLLLGNAVFIPSAWSDSLATTAPTSVTTSSSTKTTTDAAGNTHTTTDWNREDSYWRDNYTKQSYYHQGQHYEQYQPAYQYGVNAYEQNGGKRFEDLNEAELRAGWEKSHGASNMSWTDARGMVHDSYTRMYETSGPAGGAKSTTTTTISH